MKVGVRDRTEGVRTFSADFDTGYITITYPTISESSPERGATMCKADMSQEDISEASGAKKKKASGKRLAPKFKKAPGAPRRFKSAFIFFSTEKHKEIRSQLGDKGSKEKTTNVAKLVSEAWKNLSPEERDYWDERARNDKERYEMEKSLYEGPWKVPAQKSSKDPSAPKRPMSAFLAFSNSKRSLVKQENPGLNNAEVSRVLASLWRNADESEKQRYIEEEYELRQKYKTRIADWRAAEEREKELQRRAREEMALRTLEAHKRQLEEGNNSEWMQRQHELNSLPLLQVPPHLASLGEGRDRVNFGRTPFAPYNYDEHVEHPFASMDQLSMQQPAMQHMMNPQYGAYGQEQSMSSMRGVSAFDSAQSLYDHQQSLISNLQQQQPHWGGNPAPHSHNSALLNALTAQNRGAYPRHPQVQHTGRYAEDYQQQQPPQSGQRDVDFNNLFDPSLGY